MAEIGLRETTSAAGNQMQAMDGGGRKRQRWWMVEGENG
uniref:Uncharacterized protein n=1 Tax=Cucumis melo TaxID=3656 RepID=A0A9I9E1Q9_CUCME